MNEAWGHLEGEMRREGVEERGMGGREQRSRDYRIKAVSAIGCNHANTQLKHANDCVSSVTFVPVLCALIGPTDNAQISIATIRLL